MQRDFLWSEKYRPTKICDVILPDSLKATFQSFVDQDNVPNLILSGSSGVGKTTVAMAMLDEIGCDYIKVNGSLEGRTIDTLRTTINQFASTVSLSGGRKYVIIDEADWMNPQTVQPALRGFMEEYSKNCGFILTCNYKNRISEHIHSRCTVIDFLLNKEEREEMARQFYKRVKDILGNQDVEYKPNVISALIVKHFPDFRRVLNELQKYAAQCNNIIDDGILSQLSDVSIVKLVEYLKEKNFTAMRKWVAENLDTDVSIVFRKFYTTAHEYMQPKSIPQLVLILADYQYKAAFVADQEINLAACMTEIMANCEWR